MIQSTLDLNMLLSSDVEWDKPHIQRVSGLESPWHGEKPENQFQQLYAKRTHHETNKVHGKMKQTMEHGLEQKWDIETAVKVYLEQNRHRVKPLATFAVSLLVAAYS